MITSFNISTNIGTTENLCAFYLDKKIEKESKPPVKTKIHAESFAQRWFSRSLKAQLSLLSKVFVEIQTGFLNLRFVYLLIFYFIVFFLIYLLNDYAINVKHLLIIKLHEHETIEKLPCQNRFCEHAFYFHSSGALPYFFSNFLHRGTRNLLFFSFLKFIYTNELHSTSTWLEMFGYMLGLNVTTTSLF